MSNGGFSGRKNFQPNPHAAANNFNPNMNGNYGNNNFSGNRNHQGPSSNNFNRRNFNHNNNQFNNSHNQYQHQSSFQQKKLQEFQSYTGDHNPFFKPSFLQDPWAGLINENQGNVPQSTLTQRKIGVLDYQISEQRTVEILEDKNFNNNRPLNIEKYFKPSFLEDPWVNMIIKEDTGQNTNQAAQFYPNQQKKQDELKAYIDYLFKNGN